jgi:hypothetical protein
MTMIKRYVALLFGLCMAMMACSAPAFAVPQPNFITAYVSPEKAVLAVAATATTAATATASASAVRLCSGYRHTNKANHINRSHASLIALGVDPGDGSEEGEGDGKPAA